MTIYCSTFVSGLFLMLVEYTYVAVNDMKAHFH